MVGLNWLGVSHLRWPAMIDRGKIRAVSAGLVPDLQLRGHGLRVRLAKRGQFRGPWAGLYTASTAVVTDARSGVVDYVAAIDVVHPAVADIVDAAVVVEMAAIPVAALVANAGVAKAVVHIAIEANVRSPVSVKEGVAAAGVAPVAGRPQRAFIGSLNPCAGNPVVAVEA